MTKTGKSGTNPGNDVTASPSFARAWLRRLLALPGWWAQFIVCALFTLVHAGIEGASVASDLARNNVSFRPAAPWIWAFSSAFALLVCFVPVLMFDAALRERVRSAALRAGAYVLASLAFCAAHVVMMVALRHLAYLFAGWQYDFGPWLAGLIYEYRKDALTFALMVGLAAAWRIAFKREYGLVRSAADRPLADQPASAEPAVTNLAPTPPTFMVRTTQGDLLIRADEIDWVEAQGNYVALHVNGNARLLRHTLAEMETRLKEHGFIRTHRSALVNRLRMQAIIPPEMGELGVRLSSGQVAPLSESRRPEVVRLVLGS